MSSQIRNTEFRQEVLNVKIDLDLLKSIDRKYLNDTEINRIEFLIHVDNEIKRAIDMHSCVDYYRLRLLYSTKPDQAVNRKTVYVLLAKILEPGATYYDFIFIERNKDSLGKIVARFKNEIVTYTEKFIKAHMNDEVLKTMSQPPTNPIHICLFNNGNFRDWIGYEQFCKILSLSDEFSDESREWSDKELRQKIIPVRQQIMESLKVKIDNGQD